MSKPDKLSPPDEFLYEYCMVRYVPNLQREEFINIGLLMLCKRQKWMKGRIKLDNQRILAFDSNADCNLIQTGASIFERSDLPAKDIPVEERYRWLSAVKSAIIQTSPSHPGIILSLSENHLFKEENEIIKKTGEVKDNENLKKIKTLEDEFERLFILLVG